MSLEKNAISEYRKLHMELVRLATQRQLEIVRELITMLPESAKAFGQEDTALHDIVFWGGASRKYREDETEIYGCADLDELERMFGEIQQAFDGYIEIDVDKSEGYRYVVHFRLPGDEEIKGLPQADQSTFHKAFWDIPSALV